MAPLLQVERLTTVLDGPNGVVRVVDAASFDVETGETVGLVGESGSGKTLTACSILRLLQPPARLVEGQVVFEGRDLVAMTEQEMRKIRGRRIGFVFQDPSAALNPVFPVGDQLAETVRAHAGCSRAAAKGQARDLLDAVRVPDATRRLGDYPHHLSGGLLQRVMIAMALAGRPSLLIADEPTSALDVTIQAQILDLLRELRATLSLSVLLITHDLGVLASMADRVAVMQAGRIVERASIHDLFASPAHPYTQDLLASVTRPARTARRMEAR